MRAKKLFIVIKKEKFTRSGKKRRKTRGKRKNINVSVAT